MRVETERLIVDEIRPEDKEIYFVNISHDQEVLKTFICQYQEYVSGLSHGNAPANEYEQAIVDHHIGDYGICVNGEKEGILRYIIGGEYKGGPVPEGMTFMPSTRGNGPCSILSVPCPMPSSPSASRSTVNGCPGIPTLSWPETRMSNGTIQNARTKKPRTTIVPYGSPLSANNSNHPPWHRRKSVPFYAVQGLLC